MHLTAVPAEVLLAATRISLRRCPSHRQSTEHPLERRRASALRLMVPGLETRAYWLAFFDERTLNEVTASTRLGLQFLTPFLVQWVLEKSLEIVFRTAKTLGWLAHSFYARRCLAGCAVQVSSLFACIHMIFGITVFTG